MVSHELTAYLSVFYLFLTQWIMAISSKGCKPDNFESHNSLKLSFTNIYSLHSNFVECESFLESGVPQGSILSPTLFLSFLMMLFVILLSVLMILLFTLNVIRRLIHGNNWNWLLNLNLIYMTLWTGAGSGLLIPMLEKLNWFHLTSLVTLIVLMWKYMCLFLRKNQLLRCWGWLSLQNWIRALTLSLLLKLPPRKLEPWFVLWSFFLLRLLCISVNLPYNHAWNTVVMSRLVLLVATWNC